MKQVLLKYRIRILSIVLMMLGGAFVQQSYGQIVTQTAGVTTGALTNAANSTLGSANLLRGSSLATAATCAGTFTSTSFTTQTYQPTSSNNYIQASVTANAGFQLNVTGISAGLRINSNSGTGAGPSVQIAYSTDGGTSWTSSGALTTTVNATCATTAAQTFSASFTVAPSVQLLVRIYGYASGSAQTGILAINSFSINGTVAALPACVAPSNQPTGLTFSANTTTTLTTSFTGNAASGWLVIRSTGTVPSQPVNGTTYTGVNIGNLGSGLTVLQSTGTTTSFPQTTLTANTAYSYYVFSYNNTACTGGPTYSAAAALSGTTYTCIGNATGLGSAPVTNNSANITWTAPTGGTVTSFDLKYKRNVDASYTTIPGVTSPFSLTGLTSNTLYNFQIVSNNTNNTSCGSSTVSGTNFTTALDPCVAPLDQPTGMAITLITTTTLRVAFTGNASSGWLVIRSTGTVPTQPQNGTTYTAANIASLGSGLTVVQSTGTTAIFNQTALNSNTNYTYYVFSYNNTACASIAYSTAAPLSASGYTCIVAPTGLTATSASFTSENISWTASTGTVTSYDLNYKLAAAGTYTTITGVTSPFVLTGLTSNTAYNYQLVANNTNNTGAASCASATTVASNFTTTGNPTTFAIATIATQTEGSPFSVTVQAKDASGTLEPVLADTYFTFSTNGNAGPNGGTLGGFIAAGNSSGTLSGVDFLASGIGVTITATNTGVGDNLTPGTSAGFIVGSNATDYFRTVISGGFWATNTTWQSSFDGTTWGPSATNSVASTAPVTTGAKLINIRNGHTVNVNATLGVANVLIDNGGIMDVTSNVVVTISNGTNANDLDVNGKVTLDNGSIVTAGGAIISFNGTGVYDHSRDGGTIPTATWSDGSYCFVSGISTTIPGGLNPTNGFYNFTWNSNVTAAGLSINGGLTNVRGDFRYYGVGNSLRLTSTAALTMTVGGNFIDSSAIIFRLTDGASSPIINVTGDFRQYLAGTFDFGASTGAGTINVGGNYLRTGNSTQQKSSATGTLFGTINFNGINKTITNSGTQTSSGVNFNITNGSIMSLASNFQISSTGTTNSLSIANGGTLFCGAFNVTGAVFTMNTNSTLGIGSLSSTGGIQTATANGNIQTITRTYAAGGNYIYDGASAQFTGNGLPANLTGNLIISNAGGVSLSAATTLNGQLNFTAGKLNTNNLALTLAATSTISGAGVNSHILVGNGVTKTGTLVRTGVTDASNGFFPMGDGTYYLPATVSGAAGETYTGFVFSPVSTTGVFNGPAYADLSGAVNAVWDISSTSTNATITLDWSHAISLEGSRLLAWGGNELGISHYTGGAWLPAVGSGNNFTHTATANFTSFSPFSIGSVGAPLPVTLSQFDATLNSDNTTNITWTTDIEINSAYFNVLRSTNGVDYTSIGSVTSHGNSSVQNHYQYTDPTPVTGVTYYRLQMVDLDGSSKYSEIKVVRPSAVTSISIFPNPARNFVNVSLGMNISKNLVIRLISQNGQLLQQKTVTNGAGTTISLPVSQYAEGMYLLQLIGSDGTSQSHKIIIGKQ